MPKLTLRIRDAVLDLLLGKPDWTEPYVSRTAPPCPLESDEEVGYVKCGCGAIHG